MSKNLILISIIIPTYNRAKEVCFALDSVISQTYKTWECLVVDDGSIDNSIQILETYTQKDSRIKSFIRNREPKGAPTSRNIGLQHAKGEYIIFLDSDDYLLPHCLEQRVSQIYKFPNAHFLVFPMAEQNGNEIVKREIPESDDYLIHFLSANLPWQTMCPIWKKNYLIELKGFTEGYPRFNDPELMIRALVHNKVEFKIFNLLEYDCVHNYDTKIDLEFCDKIYNTMLKFIPDITKLLDNYGLKVHQSYLLMYLHLWFKFFYIPSGDIRIKQSLNLMLLFKKQHIISNVKLVDLSLRFIIYNLTKRLIKKPINKLENRTIYIK